MRYRVILYVNHCALAHMQRLGLIIITLLTGVSPQYGWRAIQISSSSSCQLMNLSWTILNHIIYLSSLCRYDHMAWRNVSLDDCQKTMIKKVNDVEFADNVTSLTTEYQQARKLPNSVPCVKANWELRRHSICKDRARIKSGLISRWSFSLLIAA